MFSGQSRLTPASGILSRNKQIHKLIYYTGKSSLLYSLLVLYACWYNLRIQKTVAIKRAPPPPPPQLFCAPFHTNNTPCNFTHTCNDLTHISSPQSVLVSLQVHTWRWVAVRFQLVTRLAKVLFFLFFFC